MSFNFFYSFFPIIIISNKNFDNNSNAPYCQVVIAQKLEKLEKKKVIQETPQMVK